MQAYMLLWAIIVVAVPFCFALGLVQMWKEREKRDGKR